MATYYHTVRRHGDLHLAVPRPEAPGPEPGPGEFAPAYQLQRLAWAEDSGDPSSILDSVSDSGGEWSISLLGGTATVDPDSGAWWDLGLCRDMRGDQLAGGVEAYLTRLILGAAALEGADPFGDTDDAWFGCGVSFGPFGDSGVAAAGVLVQYTGGVRQVVACARNAAGAWSFGGTGSSANLHPLDAGGKSNLLNLFGQTTYRVAAAGVKADLTMSESGNGATSQTGVLTPLGDGDTLHTWVAAGRTASTAGTVSGDCRFLLALLDPEVP